MKDRFSNHAKEYARYRPTYPTELFQFLYQHVHDFERAWDAGTGNGQCAAVLANQFKEVYATDISPNQLSQADLRDNIYYSIANELTSFPDRYFDLITVAQAAHWFNMNIFSQEVRRVSKQHGIVAIWGYSLLKVNDEIDHIINRFYKEIIGPYWDKERHHIDEHFANIYFPFSVVEVPEFSMQVTWTFSELIGYINTWSAVRQYISIHKINPVTDLAASVKTLWHTEQQIVKFPLFLKLGHVN